MVGFGKVSEFEIDREGFGDAMRVFDVHFLDRGAGFRHAIVFGDERPRRVATLDQQPAELLDACK